MKTSISFDGLDGVGKSTFVNAFAEFCRESGLLKNYIVKVTKEPFRECKTPEDYYYARLQLQKEDEIPFLLSEGDGLLIKDRSYLSAYNQILRRELDEIPKHVNFSIADGIDLGGAFIPTYSVAVCFPLQVPKQGEVEPSSLSVGLDRKAYSRLERSFKEKGERVNITYAEFKKLNKFYEESGKFDFRIRPLDLNQADTFELCRNLAEALGILF